MQKQQRNDGIKRDTQGGKNRREGKRNSGRKNREMREEIKNKERNNERQGEVKKVEE
jgi:hypothetical protein